MRCARAIFARLRSCGRSICSDCASVPSFFSAVHRKSGYLTPPKTWHRADVLVTARTTSTTTRGGPEPVRQLQFSCDGIPPKSTLPVRIFKPWRANPPESEDRGFWPSVSPPVSDRHTRVGQHRETHVARNGPPALGPSSNSSPICRSDSSLRPCAGQPRRVYPWPRERSRFPLSGHLRGLAKFRPLPGRRLLTADPSRQSDTAERCTCCQHA